MAKLSRAALDISWFAPVPRVLPANNNNSSSSNNAASSERGLRELVVHRKVHGGHSPGTQTSKADSLRAWWRRRTAWQHAGASRYV